MKIKLFTIPNILTLSNLICGSLAIHAVIASHNYVAAFWLIIAAAVFDFFDGFAARLLGCSSPLGLQLDSLADMVSFGVAPAMVMSSLMIDSPLHFECRCDLWCNYSKYIPYIIIAFSALRLAKFNIDTEQSSEFIGLPTPACALVCVSLGLIFAYGYSDIIRVEWIAIISLALAILLISPIRMFALKFKNFSWTDNKLRYSFMAMALLLLIIKPLFATPTIIFLYITISVIRELTHRSSKA